MKRLWAGWRTAWDPFPKKNPPCQHPRTLESLKWPSPSPAKSTDSPPSHPPPSPANATPSTPKSAASPNPAASPTSNPSSNPSSSTPPADAPSRQPLLSSIIASYASAGMLDNAVRTFRSLPTVASLNALLSACNHTKTLSPRVPGLLSALSLSHSLSPDNVSYGILIKSHCLARDFPKALLVLEEMRDKGIEITSTPYATIMYSLYKGGMDEEAEADRLWEEMRARNVRPDVAAYNVRALRCVWGWKLYDVLGLVEEMKAAGMEPDIFTYNYLMFCYCKHRRAEDAKRVYKEIVGKGFRPNTATYKNLLDGLCENEDFAGGVEVLEDCVKDGRAPDLRSLLGLVKGLMKGCKVRAAKRVVIGLRKKFPDDFGGRLTQWCLMLKTNLRD